MIIFLVAIHTEGESFLLFSWFGGGRLCLGMWVCESKERRDQRKSINDYWLLRADSRENSPYMYMKLT